MAPGARRAIAPKVAAPSGKPPLTAISARRRKVYLVVTLALPLLVLGGVELMLRLLDPAGALPLFVAAPGTAERYLVANRNVGKRFFAGERAAPAPPPELFAAAKPANAFRLFVLGESTTAGFPYPRNGAFSRVLADALRDALPRDSVEVINLGIAATNSYALRDIAGEVAAQDPDAVLIYAGHNEYYGTLGVASTLGGSAFPGLVHATLVLQRLRITMALRNVIASFRARGSDVDSAPSFMEVLARDRTIVLGGSTFRRGVVQFERNLRDVVHELHQEGVPVFIASLASNLRDQPPFTSPANAVGGGAQSAYRRGLAALRRGDSVLANAAFREARDLDVVRFRAPSVFDSIVRRVASGPGATYVPVEELFASQAPSRAPGAELFLEHVHPTKHGAVLIARAFYEALSSSRFLGRQSSPERLRPWEEYERRMALSEFDERVAHHTVQTIIRRWPFVPSEVQQDYRGTYRPSGLVDSLALLVSRGGALWDVAKLEVASDYARRGLVDSAVVEYRGLARDQPVAEYPLRLQGRTLHAAGRLEEAEATFREAMRRERTGEAAFALGRIELERKRVADAIQWLEQATTLSPTDPAPLYQLSLAYGLARDIDRARATALAVQRIDRNFPGLSGWMSAIGLTP